MPNLESNLHGQIMNIPVPSVVTLRPDSMQELRSYKLGHRDARHAAAEIAMRGDAEIERLREELAKAEELREAARVFYNATVAQKGIRISSDFVELRDAAVEAGKVLREALLAKPISEDQQRANRLLAHVEKLATSYGWKKESAEGAFEFVQRQSYALGIEDQQTRTTVVPQSRMVLRITTAYEQGVGKAKTPGVSNPYPEGSPENEAWELGRKEGAK